MATPKPPGHFSREMKVFWRQINSEFELEVDARLILRAACENWDRAQMARESVNEAGILVEGRRNPACDVEKVAYGLFLRSMRQLGLDIEAPGPVGRPAGR